MKWKKIGKIFDPRQHTLPHHCTEFAQSPQTLMCDDYMRIYFSTRETDTYGKYVSHIAYVDMDKNFKNIIRISKHTVIESGDLGCFDEHGIFPLHICKHNGKIFGYIGGWSRRVSVPVETSIGLALSRDKGETFKRIGNGPVVTSSVHEPYMVGDPFVRIYDDIFHMWYIYGTKWLTSPADREPQRVYKIGHAVSKDGISWHKENKQIISDTLNSSECQALPTVMRHKNRYHMIFCYRQATGFRKNKKRGYRLGYAFSENLTDWVRDDDNVGITVSQDGWDSDMMCYPHVVKSGNTVYLLYNGNEFGRFGFGLAVLESI